MDRIQAESLATHAIPGLKGNQIADPEILVEEEGDILDLRSKDRPRLILQRLSEEIEVVGGKETLKEVVEERLEQGSQTLRSRVEVVRTQLGRQPEDAALAQAHLDPDRIRQLLLDS